MDQAEKNLRKAYPGIPLPPRDEQATRLGIQAAALVGVVAEPHPLSTEPNGNGSGNGMSKRLVPPAPADGEDGPLRAAAQRLKAGFLNPMGAIFGHLEISFRLLTGQIGELTAVLDGAQKAAAVAQFRVKHAQERLDQTQTFIAALPDPDTDQRRLPTRLYVPCLVITAIATAFINAVTLQILREPPYVIIPVALVLGGLWALAVHVIGLGLTDDSPRRSTRFWGSVGLLALVTVGTLAYTQLRSDYLHAIHKPSESWPFLVLQLVIDGLGIFTAVLHANRYADRIFENRRKLNREAEEARVHLEHAAFLEREIEALQQELASDVACHLDDVHRLGQLEEAALATLRMAFAHQSSVPLASRLVVATDFTPEFPPQLAEWEAWLVEYGDDLGRPRRVRNNGALGLQHRHGQVVEVKPEDEANPTGLSPTTA